MNASRFSSTRFFLHSSYCLGLLTFLFLVFALVAQHLMGIEPCHICVQIRALALLALVLIAVSLSVWRHFWLVLPLHLLIVAILATSSNLSHNIYLSEIGEIFLSCSMRGPFDGFLPIDSWLPSVFESRGICGRPEYLYGKISFAYASYIAFALSFLFSYLMGAFYEVIVGKKTANL